MKTFTKLTCPSCGADFVLGVEGDEVPVAPHHRLRVPDGPHGSRPSDEVCAGVGEPLVGYDEATSARPDV